MKHIYYTNYQSGNSGLSNAVMSIEIGVVLAFLTNRFLVLDGNTSPPANLVDYAGRVDNSSPSRVTDLIELPVPWDEFGTTDLHALHGRELTDQHLMDSVFYVPGTVDIESADARSFARGRSTWLCQTEELAEVPVLRVSEDALVPEQGRNRRNLCFYSYFFYFDEETRRAAYQVLRRMQPKSPYAALARKVARDLGKFNAVHMRRGDFKVTYGVTILDRHPWEAIEALEPHFGRTERLLICTDERDDPFFDEIRAAWPDHVFIDHHILDHYGSEFAELPRQDCIALAYLSQLVAAESEDFVGTMTSTFTSMIQRYRGNRGKQEPFKFLWNELPDPGERAERGRHRISECIPLDQGVMIEEFKGPYSWNRYSQRLNPAWMREWPESFLTESVLETGLLADHAPTLRLTAAEAAGRTEARLAFEGLAVRVRSSIPGVAFRLSEMLHQGDRTTSGSIVAEIDIGERDGRLWVSVSGRECCDVATMDEVPSAVVRQLARYFTHARRLHSWLSGMVFHRDGRSIVFAGDLGTATDSIADQLCSSGWEMLADTAVPVRIKTREAVPFARCTWPKGAAARIEQVTTEVSAIVHAKHRLHGRDAVKRLSPAAAVAELLLSSIDFEFDRDRAVKRLCQIIEEVPVFHLSYSRAANVPRMLDFLAELESPVRSETAAAEGDV